MVLATITDLPSPGAGNQISVLVCDILHKLFAEDQVLVLKMNPANAVVGPTLSAALRPLIDAGVLSFVYGGTVRTVLS